MPAIEMTDTAAPRAGSLRTRHYLSYAVASVGTGMVAAVPGLLLMYFMTSVLAIPAALAGLGVFLPKLWDMFWDPAMGMISDRTRSRWGRRRPYLLAGALLTMICFPLLFIVPAFESATWRFFYVVAMFLLCATASSVFAVPYIAMASEMSDEPHERTVIMSWRMAFVTAGLLIGSGLGPYLVAAFGGGVQGYRGMGLSLGLVCGCAMLLTFFGTSKLPLSNRPSTHLGLGAQLLAARSNRPFFVLLAVYLVQLVGIGSFAAVIPYFVIHIAGMDEKFVGLAMLLLFGTSLLAMPPWVWLARRRSKPSCLLLSAALFALASATLAGLEKPGQELIIVLLVLMGVGFAGAQLFPFSMLTDTIAHDLRQSGQHREGMFTGLLLAGEKAGLAFGPLIAGFILSATGFSSTTATLAQAPQALTGIRIAFGLLPALLMLVSLLLLPAYQRAFGEHRPH